MFEKNSFQSGISNKMEVVFYDARYGLALKVCAPYRYGGMPVRYTLRASKLDHSMETKIDGARHLQLSLVASVVSP